MAEIQSINEQEVIEHEKSQVVYTPGQLVIKRFFRNKLAILGLGIIIAVVLFAVIGPMISPHGESEIFYKNDSTGEIFSGTKEPEKLKDIANVGVYVKGEMDSQFWLGTDANGMDTFTRLMYGCRISLMFSIVVTIIEMLLGITLGGIAGYYGGKVDMIIMRLVEIFYCIPFVPLMLLVSTMMVAFGILPEQKIYWLMMIMGFFNWSGVARMVRGQVLTIREMDYMQAAEAGGISVRRKIFKHLIPNAMPVIIVMASMDLGSFILTESTLSYLGVGISTPFASLGTMIQAVNQSVILKNYLNLWIPPGIMLLLIVLAFNFIGDGLRDAFDPKMKR
ncbi:ABC transporter permease [Cuneatibacter caecimuris]|uniref:Peptide/nickel transport system permease protein n=1 Tax=Cuneatibacter caecimuris TaxID=1796618 RepID=A0A4Q7PN39_9FIRM|nr:ABC transporter permease [Cuneatibacter caecimuris]RZT02342.1 peptide/nickel transport system permease protein [Cuneatibacter caecimuris]